MGKAATLKAGDSLIFGDGSRYIKITEIDFRRKTVKVIAEAPEFIRVSKESLESDSEVSSTKN